MSQRIFTNREIQEKLSKAVQKLTDDEIEKFCLKNYSNLVFRLNFALLFKMPNHSTNWEKSDAVRDDTKSNRWTWKFEFEKNGYVYGITTQWYKHHDENVQRWLRKNGVN